MQNNSMLVVSPFPAEISQIIRMITLWPLPEQSVVANIGNLFEWFEFCILVMCGAVGNVYNFWLQYKNPLLSGDDAQVKVFKASSASKLLADQTQQHFETDIYKTLPHVSFRLLVLYSGKPKDPLRD